MSNFHTILTDIGRAKLADAVVAQSPLTATIMAFGDGNGSPTNHDATALSLIHEVHRTNITHIAPVAGSETTIEVKAVVPFTVGGFTLREAALLDQDGTVLALANLPETEKIAATNAAKRELAVTFYVTLENLAGLTFETDPSQILATRNYVEEELSKKNLATLLPGGKTGDYLVKNSDQDGDMGWQKPLELKTKEISWISQSGHNAFAMIYDGKLYATHGKKEVYHNPTSGRGTQSPNISLENMQEIPLPEKGQILQAGGFYYSYAFALFDSGNLYVWGNNNTGVCGLGHTNPVPFPKLAATNVQQVFFETSQSGYPAENCSIFVKKQDGTIWAAGTNTNGQLGLGTTSNALNFIQVTNLGTDCAHIYPFKLMSVAVMKDNRIFVTGYNGTGALGTGGTARLTSFTDVSSFWGNDLTEQVVSAHAVSSYRYDSTKHYPVLYILKKKQDGSTKIYSCGSNHFAAIGRGDVGGTNQVTPYLVPHTENVKEFSVMGGIAACYMLNELGDLYVWGRNNEGQMGLGTTATVPTPTIMDQNVETIFMDGADRHYYGFQHHFFYRKADGLYGCGYNAQGQMGNGTTGNKILPQKILLPPNIVIDKVTQMNSTSQHSSIIAASTDHRLFAWGANGQNSIHLSSTENLLVPYEIRLPQ